MSTQLIQEVPLDRIAIRGQVREQHGDKDVTAMALSMKFAGLLYAILLRPENGELLMVDGATRFLAARKLGWQSIKAIIDDRELPEDVSVHRALCANLRRTDMKPLEIARGIARLMKLTGWSATDTAARLGMSNGALSRAVSVLSLPEAIAQQVDAGAIPVSSAYALSKVPDPGKQSELAAAVVAGQLTRDALAGATKSKRNRGSAGPGASRKRVAIHLDGGRMVTVAGKALTPESVIEALQESLAKVLGGELDGWNTSPSSAR